MTYTMPVEGAEFIKPGPTAHTTLLHGEVIDAYPQLVRVWRGGMWFAVTRAFILDVQQLALEQHAHTQALDWCHDNGIRHLEHLRTQLNDDRFLDADAIVVLVEFWAAGVRLEQRPAPRKQRRAKLPYRLRHPLAYRRMRRTP